MKTTGKGWQMVEPSAPLQQREWTVADPGAAEVVVKIAGCGVCHTDLGFLYGGVRTKNPCP